METIRGAAGIIPQGEPGAAPDLILLTSAGV